MFYAIAAIVAVCAYMLYIHAPRDRPTMPSLRVFFGNNESATLFFPSRRLDAIGNDKKAATAAVSFAYKENLKYKNALASRGERSLHKQSSVWVKIPYPR